MQVHNFKKMRNKKNNVHDVFEPINIAKYEIDNDGCFGKMWDGSCQECKMCSDNAICCIITAKQNEVLIASIENKNGFAFLDKTNFNRIPINKLLLLIEQNPLKYSFEDIFAIAKKYSECSDNTTIKYWTVNFIKENNLIINEDKKLSR